MNIILSLAAENAAFGETDDERLVEVGRILARVGGRLMDEPASALGWEDAEGIKMRLMDANGNACGVLRIHPTP